MDKGRKKNKITKYTSLNSHWLYVYISYTIWGYFFFLSIAIVLFFRKGKKGPFPFGLQNAWENFRKKEVKAWHEEKWENWKRKKKLSYALCHVHIKGTWMFFHYISCELLHTHVQMKKCYFSILRVHFLILYSSDRKRILHFCRTFMYIHKMLDLRERYLCVYDRSLNFFSEDGI